MKKIIIAILILLIVAAGVVSFYLWRSGFFKTEIMPDKSDLIRVDNVRPNQIIASPLVITGEARGNWYFEASFPVVLVNWDGLIIAQGIATAKSDWMTSEFVPFEAKLTFTVDKNAYSNRGALILRKDNPSGLPEHDDALEIPVLFAK